MSRVGVISETGGFDIMVTVISNEDIVSLHNNVNGNNKEDY